MKFIHFDFSIYFSPRYLKFLWKMRILFLFLRKTNDGHPPTNWRMFRGAVCQDFNQNKVKQPKRFPSESPLSQKLIECSKRLKKIENRTKN